MLNLQLRILQLLVNAIYFTLQLVILILNLNPKILKHVIFLKPMPHLSSFQLAQYERLATLIRVERLQSCPKLLRIKKYVGCVYSFRFTRLTRT